MEAFFSFELFMNLCFGNNEVNSQVPNKSYCQYVFVNELVVRWLELITSVSFRFCVCSGSSYVSLHTKHEQENTDRHEHACSSAMPRDVIWQLSALIGPEHVGRETPALNQVCKGALSGS